MKFFNKIKDALHKTSSNLSKGISDIFTKKKLDESMLSELEDLLISSDVGIDCAKALIGELRTHKFEKDINAEQIKHALASEVEKRLKAVEGQVSFDKAHPHTALICGVNGNGKTTTIGKLAALLVAKKKKVLLVACDTFRAAAVAQLEIWSKKAGVDFIAGEQESDPASVAYRACEQAKLTKTDCVLIDTAGRLSNKKDLMLELAKIIRVIKKCDDTAPHDTILVIDATTGQHALTQIQEFKSMVDLTGLIVTKLDGSAKAGVILAIAEKFKIPILAIGVGEGIDDLEPFNAAEFAKNLIAS